MKNTIKTGFIAFLAIAALGISSCGVEASTSGGTATYAVTYNANGGSGVLADPGSPYESGAAVTVLANTFTKPGYVFTGWNTAADGSGTAYHAGAVFTINADTTLYAQWAAEGTVFTVTYNANGGSGSLIDPDSPYASWAAVTVLANTFTKPGYIFNGWNTAADGSGTAYQAGASFAIYANTTLYAQWVAEGTTYTVTYNANGGIGSLTDPSSPYAVGSAVTVLANTFTKSGYAFTGWNTAADGSGTAYQAGATFTINANTTLYAQWGVEGMVWIPAGTFQMGSPANEPNRETDETQHSVTLTTGFWMGKYEVTQEKYLSITGNSPSSFSGNNLPVEQVTWYDAVEFCNKLSVLEGLTPVYTITGRSPASGYPITNATVTADWSADGYRLPTEAEWEYACRAGTTTPFNTGNNITTDQANYNGNYPYNGNPTGTYRAKTTEVGTFAPNAWGLHDMHGNVWEWCWDLYGSSYYTDPSAGLDPMGAVSDTNRVVRGGSRVEGGQNLRSACRSAYYPFNGGSHLGFRLVRR